MIEALSRMTANVSASAFSHGIGIEVECTRTLLLGGVPIVCSDFDVLEPWACPYELFECSTLILCQSLRRCYQFGTLRVDKFAEPLWGR